MSENSFKWIMILAVTFFGLAAVFTLLTAVGTVCVAWNAQIYPPFFALIPLMTVFQYLVYGNLAASAFGFTLIYPLAKGDRRAYYLALSTILAFLATAVIQMYYSSSARGIPFFASAPTNMRLYSTLFVAAFFLFLRIPSIWKSFGFNYGKTDLKYYRTSISVFLLLAGVIILTTSNWAASSHIVDGVNMISNFEVPLYLGGFGALFSGSTLLLFNRAGPQIEWLILRIQQKYYSILNLRRRSSV